MKNHPSIPTASRTPSNPRSPRAMQASKIAALRETLVSEGYDTVPKQMKVLGLSRTTTWHLFRGAYKGPGLSASTVNRILSSPNLPASARKLIEEYVEERLQGSYGHNRQGLKVFRKKIGQHELPAEPR